MGTPFQNYNREKGDKDAICSKEEGTLGGARLFLNVVHQNREEGHQLFGIESLSVCVSTMSGKRRRRFRDAPTSLTSRPRTSSWSKNYRQSRAIRHFAAAILQFAEWPSRYEIRVSFNSYFFARSRNIFNTIYFKKLSLLLHSNKLFIMFLSSTIEIYRTQIRIKEFNGCHYNLC